MDLPKAAEPSRWLTDEEVAASYPPEDIVEMPGGGTAEIPHSDD